ncbi:MAG: CPXCG motif-containing cysteine-rich protein [Oceanospirillaceae bacterium]|nr:CPXCG motif-containing cysteine-rich protein [Oceanospirillaceae bacterium]
MNQLTEKTIGCPYCGEIIDVLIDITDLDQQYIEDCQVCCKPIVFVVSENEHAELIVRVFSEDEAF